MSTPHDALADRFDAALHTYRGKQSWRIPYSLRDHIVAALRSLPAAPDDTTVTDAEGVQRCITCLGALPTPFAPDEPKRCEYCGFPLARCQADIKPCPAPDGEVPQPFDAEHMAWETYPDTRYYAEGDGAIRRIAYVRGATDALRSMKGADRG